MRKKTLSVAASLLLAASLAMSGCTYSFQIGGKEITNRKELGETAVEDTEESEETKEETNARETELETAEATVATVKGSRHGTFEIPLSRSASIFYGGPYDLHLDGTGGKVDYQNGDRKLTVTLVDDETALNMALGFAAIGHPETLGVEYRDIVDGALDGSDLYTSQIAETRGYAWDGNSAMNVNLDALYFKVEADGVSAESLLVFTGSDQNIMVVYTAETGIPVESIGIVAKASDKELWVADADEVDLAVWLKAMVDKLEEEETGDVSGQETPPAVDAAFASDTVQYDGEGSLVFKSGSGTSYSFSIPGGYEMNYSSEDVITFDWTLGWGNAIGFWGFEYTPYPENTQALSSMPYICYMRSSEYTDTYNYVIDDNFYIQIEIHKEEGRNKDTLAEADALLSSILK